MIQPINERELTQFREAAEDFARKGGDSTLEYFKDRSFGLEFKSDQSPVTRADRESEEIIREEIISRFPDHGIIGEEYGSEGEDKDVVWVIDPIDGTHSFIHGVPLYSTLIGVLINGSPLVGVIYVPAQKELVSAAAGMGAQRNGKTCRARTCNELGEATFLTTDVVHIYKYEFYQPFKELIDKTRIHRTWGDAYGHLMVATGRADIMFDPILSIWDAAALLPVVSEAGGSFSDVYGTESIETGNALSCASGLQNSVLELFKKHNKA